MQKRGFTLAEILISVGIVGVIAAIMLPMVNKYKPDENKILYLRTYDSLLKVMPSIVNNKTAYPLLNENDDIVYNNYPLFNTKALFKTTTGEVISGPKKFCVLLASGFNTIGEISCSDAYETSAYPTFKKSFETPNGVQFMVQTKSEQKDNKAVYQTDIFIDVNGPNGSNCFVTEPGCKDPDKFKLMVSSDGVIKSGDPLGQYFLDTRTNWKLNRDKSVTGNMIADLDLKLKEKLLEILPPDELELPGGDDSNNVNNYNACYQGGFYSARHVIFGDAPASWSYDGCYKFPTGMNSNGTEHIHNNLNLLEKTQKPGLYLYKGEYYVIYGQAEVSRGNYRPAWVVFQIQANDGTRKDITKEQVEKYLSTGSCDDVAIEGKTCFGLSDPPNIYMGLGEEKINDNGYNW